MIVNHVYSGELSGIFLDIFNRYKEYSRKFDITMIKSNMPIESADIYHYHRPNKCIIEHENSVSTLHFNIDDPYQGVDKKKFIENLTRCKTVICLNERSSKELMQYGINTKIIRHGFDEHLAWSSIKKTKSKIVIGFVSKRYRDGRKGERYLVKLASSLDRSKFGFLFVGDGWFSVVLSLRLLGFSVSYERDRPYHTFPEIYKKIHILYIGSIYEAGPANIPEALLSGTYLFAHPVGAVMDYYKSNASGRLLTFDIETDVGSLNSMSYQIESNSIPEFKMNPCSWEKNFAKHVEIYKDLFW